MRDQLSDMRYTHSLGVESMSVKLAGIYGADIEKAGFAGRYHDIAKDFDQDRSDEYVRRYGLSADLIGNKSLAHSKVAAAILKKEYGVDDEEVLDAVRYHTTGRADMTLLEEIVYVSDAIEDNRNYRELKSLQRRAETDLDGVCLFIMDYTIDKIISKGKILDKATSEARASMADKVKSKNSD